MTGSKEEMYRMNNQHNGDNDDERFTPDAVDQQIDALLLPNAPLQQQHADARVLHDLTALYMQDAASLERIWERLSEHSAFADANSQGEEAQRFHIDGRTSEKTLQGQRDGSGSMQRNAEQRKRSTIVRILSSLAAVIIVGALVGSWALVTHVAVHHQTTQTATPTTKHPPTPIVPASPTVSTNQVITSIQMFGATTGWALTDQAVLRTTDGGVSWRDVTPAKGTVVQPQWSAADFITASNAWVAVPDQERTIQVFHTTNAGQTWQSATIHYSTVGIKQITFLDSQHGWILASLGAMTQAELVSILRTTDGGKTWITVSDGHYASNPPPGALPSVNDQSGLSFLTASTGWATGWWFARDFFYETHDGGQTWQHQTLPLPPSVPVLNAPLATEPPTFFTATDGILPVRFTTPTSWGLDFYVTHDGGISWQSTTPLSLSSSSPGAFFMRDLNHIWVAEGTTLYVTSDGGQRWTKITPRITTTSISTFTHLDFVSDEIGWATGSAGDHPTVLLKTVDGGYTWTEITYGIS
jgi:photosystem II stability/assembly factor-like uncharacterized protein